MKAERRPAESEQAAAEGDARVKNLSPDYARLGTMITRVTGQGLRDC